MNQTQQIVYVVDDDECVLAQVSENLAELDVEVRAFSCGREFLKAIRPDELCCVVLDIRMP